MSGPWISLVLFGYAAATAVLSPALLARARWQVHYPRCALALWIAAFATGSASMIAGAVNAIAFAAGSGGRVEGTLAIGLSTLSIVAVTAVVALVLTSAEGVVDAQTLNSRALLAVPHRAEQRVIMSANSDTEYRRVSTPPVLG